MKRETKIHPVTRTLIAVPFFWAAMKVLLSYIQLTVSWVNEGAVKDMSKPFSQFFLLIFLWIIPNLVIAIGIALNRKKAWTSGVVYCLIVVPIFLSLLTRKGVDTKNILLVAGIYFINLCTTLYGNVKTKNRAS